MTKSKRKPRRGATKSKLQKVVPLDKPKKAPAVAPAADFAVGEATPHTLTREPAKAAQPQPQPEPVVHAGPEPQPEPEPPAQAVVVEPAPIEVQRPKAHTDSNARKYRRFPLKVEVNYTSDHNFFTGFMQNIGEGGLFVATHTPAHIGDLIEVTFSVPGLDRVCTALCRVRWIREYNPSFEDAAPGMGLQFAQLDADVRAAIDLFIGHREPIFYDD